MLANKFDIRLLGGVQVLSRNGSEPALEVHRGRNLLYYLLLHKNRCLSRERIASELSNGHGTTSRSMKNLRNALWSLQRKLRTVQGLDYEKILIVHQDSIEFRITSQLWIDVDVFERGANTLNDVSGDQLSDEQVQLALSTISLYRGRLLPGFEEPWCDHFRHQLHQKNLILLTKLTEHYGHRGAYETAISFCERMIGEEYAHESAHRLLMELYTSLGDRTSALRQYERCCKALETVFGTSPDLETDNLARRIRNGGPAAF